LAIQDFASFSLRDVGRPRRDKKSGIIPPKLARMMINITQKRENQVLLDPFCGSGTIIQEAILLGYKNIIGSDINPRAITDTKDNLHWLFEHFPEIKRNSSHIKIFSADVRQIAKYLASNSIDAVITEPYLGPPLFKKPDIFFIKKIFSTLSPLFLEAFSQFREILKPQGTVTLIFPAFEINGEIKFMETIEKIESLGFQRKEFLSRDLLAKFMINLTNRGTILYGEEKQFIKREILSFSKKK